MSASSSPSPAEAQWAATEVKLNELIDLALQYVQDLQKRDATSGVDVAQYDPSFLQREVRNGSKVLSHNATKLSLIAPEKAADTPKVCIEMQKGIVHIAAVIDSVPGSLGTTLQDELRSTTSTLMLDVATLANKFVSTPRTIDSGGLLGFMSSTGLVWKSCEVLDQMSFTNADAVRKKVENREALVQDAIEEVEETIENGGAGGVGWDDDDDDDDEEEDGGEEVSGFSDSEKELAAKCLVLVKASKLLLRKLTVSLTLATSSTPSTNTNTSASDPLETARCQDELARLADLVSQRVDDLVAHVEPPIPVAKLANAAASLAGTCVDVVETTKSLVDDPQTIAWVETCGTQISRVLEQILERRSVR
ncbi:Cyclin-D1-binding protein 1 [Thoreauomyces humboldtii]|nr:Cyclin-D1-binding protein 1 [Thoreauomyces humboldtii]